MIDLQIFRGFTFAVCCFLFAFNPVLAEQAIPPKYSEQAIADRAVKLDGLLEQLAEAKNERAGRTIQNAISDIWILGPTPETTRQLSLAMRERRSYNLEKSFEILNTLVETNPEFMEAWNQRAFTLFLMKKYEASLADLEQVLKMEPRQFAAYSGRALVLKEMGETEASQTALKEAVKLHPWIMERFLLIAE